MAEFDVVYPLGKGSTIGNIEIVYSLRSLIKHGSNIGKVFVVGEKPDLAWGPRLIHIPFRETQTRYVNIWEKLRLVASDNGISERVLWMNDDFYILQDFDAGNVPFFARAKGLDRSHLAKVSFTMVRTSYQKTLRRTLDALKKRRMTTHHFGTHQPVNFDRSKILETFEEFKPDLYQRHGLSFRTCYGNHHKVERTVKTTRLIKRTMIEPGNRFALSSHASAPALLLHKELGKLYPTHSPYETA